MNYINYLIIGLGVNIISSPKVKDYETTKLSDYSNNLKPKEIFLKTANFIIYYIHEWKKNGFLNFKNRWLECAKDIGENIRIRKDGKVFAGKFSTIDDRGQLVLKANNNTLSFSFGEII